MPNKSNKKTASKKLKKSPNAPKRFKSAYMFFSIFKHDEMKRNKQKVTAAVKGNGSGDQIKKTKGPKPAQIVSRAWKDLCPEERCKYDEMARNDKARYYVEKDMYSGPWKVTPSEYKKLNKDDNAPKKPMSSYLAYANSKRGEVQLKNPEWTNTEISRKLAEMWKVADDDEKKFYIDEELELREKYLSSMAEYKANKKVKENAKRKQREDYASSIASQLTAASKQQALLPSQQERTEIIQQHVHQQQLLQNSGGSQNSIIMPNQAQQQLVQNGGHNQHGNITTITGHYPTPVGMNNNFLRHPSTYEPKPFAPHQPLCVSQAMTSNQQVVLQDSYLSNGSTSTTAAVSIAAAVPPPPAAVAAAHGVCSGNFLPTYAASSYQQNHHVNQHQNSIFNNAYQAIMPGHYDTNAFDVSPSAAGESRDVPSIVTTSTL